jgi:uncharacterized protein
MVVSFTRLGARSPISLLAGGGFQFGGMPHRGAVLVSPDGIYAWTPAGAASDDSNLLRFLDEEQAVRGDFLLLGTGSKSLLPSARLRDEADKRGLGLEAMNTGAACRTYNVLLAERRFFCAALLTI